MYYALSDSFTGDDPRDYTSGFANTKKVIAFRSKKERDAWLSDTKLLTAKPLTRSQAIKWADTDQGTWQQEYDVAKICRIYGTDSEYVTISGYSR